MSRDGSPRVLIVAGEASGDLYGGLLMRSITRLAAASGRTVQFVGAGGPAMRAAGLQPLADASSLGVTGLLEVLAHLGTIWKAFQAAGRALRDPASRPDLAILIDYPDFNLRLAARARSAGVPVLYFISPQVWAWRKWRLRQIRRTVDRMLVILPFEAEIYREAGVPVEFVGHPLLDEVRLVRTARQERAVLGLDPDRPVVALLPGSRRNELRAHLPPMLDAARRLREEFRDLQFVMPLAPTLDRREVERLIVETAGALAPRPALASEDRYDAVAAADAAVVASGTATVETMLLGVPMVIVYRVNPITYALARAVANPPHIGMVNLMAGRRVVPELVQGDCTGVAIARELRRILTDPAVAATIRRDLAETRARLGPPGAIERAARSAWGMIRPAPAAADDEGASRAG
jgi:lipid-A-disaccharide synthase